MVHIATVAVVLALTITRVSCARTIHLTWDLATIEQYGLSNPLNVAIGDAVRIRCTNVTNIYTLNDRRQYDQCSCTIPPNVTCAANQRHQCISSNSNLTLSILQQSSGNLASVFNYNPGEPYYFAAFDTNEAGAPCLPEGDQPGLRMAIMVFQTVADITTPSTTVATTTTATGSDEPSGSTTQTSMGTELPSLGTPSVSGVATPQKTDDTPKIIGGAVVGTVVFISADLIFILLVIGGVVRRRRRMKYQYDAAAKSEAEAPEFSPPRPKAEIAPHAPKPGDPDFKEDLSISLKPNFQATPQLTRSLNQYEEVKHLIRGSTALSESGQVELKNEENNAEEKEGAETKDKNRMAKEKELELDNKQSPANDENAQSSHPTKVPRLVSIDENASLSRDLISLQTPDNVAKITSKQEFSWTPQKKDSQSSITSFTALALARVNEGDESDTATASAAADPIPLSGMTPSYSMDDIFGTVTIENEATTTTITTTQPVIVDSATLLRPKPKPRQRVAKRSESKGDELKGEELKADLLSASSKRKSILTRSTSVDGFAQALAEEEKKQQELAAATDMSTLSRPKPKPRPRGRKSESSAKENEVTLKQVHETNGDASASDHTPNGLAGHVPMDQQATASDLTVTGTDSSAT